jgi:hypothetical protein
MVLGTVAAMVAYAALIDPLGFITASFFLLLFLFRAIFGVGWVSSGAAAMLAAVTVYIVFRVWLGVQLPAGPLAL